MYSYGCGDEGRLGLGSYFTYNVNQPTLIHNLFDYRVNYVSTGFWHNIIGTDCGKIFTWGNNDEGKLGLGDTNLRSSPTEIKCLNGNFIKQACGGALHSLLLTTDNILYAWGSNHWGQLGVDSSNPKDRLVPTEVEFFRNIRMKEIAAGSNFSLCLTEDGDVFSWGCASTSKIGHGNFETKLIPEKIQKFSNDKIISIATGSNHCLFLSNSGKVYSCGWNKYYQLGLECDDPIGVPFEIKSLNGVEIKFIGAGAFYSLFASNSKIKKKTGLDILSKEFEDVEFKF